MSIGLLQFIRLSRLFDAIFPVISLFLGATVVGHFEGSNTLLLALVVIVFNSVAMIWNDIEDRKIDADNGRPELTKSGRTALRKLTLYTIIAILVGLAVAWIVSLEAFLLSIGTVCITWVYNSKPIQASRRPIASIVVLSGAGAFLPYLFGVSLGSATQNVLIAGVFWWIGRISLSILKDYKDARGDSMHHKKTFLLRFGARWVARVSVTSLLIGYVGFIAIMNMSESRAWALPLFGIALLLLVSMRRKLFDTKATYGQLDKVFRAVAQYQLLLDTGIVLWLI